MEPNDRTPKSDRILDEFKAVTANPPRPKVAPRRSPLRSAGSSLGLAGAGLLAAALVLAVAWMGRTSTTGVGGDGSPSPSDIAVAPSVSPSDVASPSVEPSLSPSPSATPTDTPAPTATPTPTATPVPPIALCDPADLRARIVSWEGAAGSRIATVTVKNDGSTACAMPTTARPELVDGDDAILAKGDAGSMTSKTTTFEPGSTLRTLVEVSNVCAQSPKAPITVWFELEPDRTLKAAPKSASDETVPPCNGPGMPAAIQMHPWSR
ncbi:MAG TPA: DUF4232 domain-containing protein [Candidatus Limnocylindrales bacterium]|jgi:hypothetical protein